MHSRAHHGSRRPGRGQPLKLAMAKIIGISGSLRRASFNAALLRAAVELAPSGSTIEIASIRDIPLYDADVEAQGIPSAVVALKEKVVAADALLLVTPEYNNSIPGVFKNAIDWLSRPSTDAPLYVSGAASVFDAEGRLIDADVRNHLEVLLREFVLAID